MTYACSLALCRSGLPSSCTAFESMATHDGFAYPALPDARTYIRLLTWTGVTKDDDSFLTFDLAAVSLDTTTDYTALS